MYSITPYFKYTEVKPMIKEDTSSFANIPALYKPTTESKLGVHGNIVAGAYTEGIKNGDIIPIKILVDGNETPIQLGIENPSLALGQPVNDSKLLNSYITSALRDHMSALQFWLKLIPSPSSLSSHEIAKNNFWVFDASFPMGHHSIDIQVSLNNKLFTPLQLEIVSLPLESSRYLIVSNSKTISSVLPCTFECLPSIDGSDTQLKKRMNDFLKYQPSLLALTLQTTPLETQSDFEITLSTIQKHHNIGISVENLISLIPTFEKQVEALKPAVETILDFETPFANLDTDIEFLRERLNIALKADRDIIEKVDFGFSLFHYGLPKNNILILKDGSIIPLVNSGFIHKQEQRKQSELNWLINNLLPEFRSDDKSFDLKRFISLSPRLISSFTIQPNHLCAILPAPNLNEVVQNPELIHSKSLELNLLSKAPITIDTHETTISDKPVFEGVVSTLPNFDTDFFDNLKSDFLEGGGVRISGVQHKALLNLSHTADGPLLRLSRGNIPSTHISKWPMMGMIDNLSVAEWLGLTLCRAGGLTVSKFQLVNSEWSTTQEQKNEQLYRSDRTLEGCNDFFDFKDIEQVKASLPALARTKKIDRHPPFILVERFDVAYEGEHADIKYVSRDFCMLAQRPSKDKYNYTMEGVADLLKQYITTKAELTAAQEHLLRLITASMSVGNNDLHLKNLTLLQEYINDELVKTSLSPVYDVLVAPMVAIQIRQEPYFQALSLNGTRRPSLNQLRSFAVEHLDMTYEAATTIVKDTIDGIKQEVLRLSSNSEVLGDDEFLKETLQFGLSLVKENLISLMTHGVEKSPTLKPVEKHHPTPF